MGTGANTTSSTWLSFSYTLVSFLGWPILISAPNGTLGCSEGDGVASLGIDCKHCLISNFHLTHLFILGSLKSLQMIKEIAQLLPMSPSLTTNV